MTSTDVTPVITDNADRGRYELVVEGEVVGTLAYRRSDGTIHFTSTVTVPAHRGQGLAAQLVEHAVREARDADVAVTTSCWYVQDWLAAHPA